MTDSLPDLPPTQTTAAATSERRPGRPPVDSKENRLNRLLDGAYSLLHEGEYGAITIDAVAKRAGMAKRTVYTLVASKEELITGIILREQGMLDALLPAAGNSELQLLDELREFMSVWARLALGPVGLGMYLIAVAHRDSAPAIADIYETQGAASAERVLHAWIEQPAVQKVFDIAAPQAAINLLSAVLIAHPLRTAALGLTKPIPDDAIVALVENALEIFKRLYKRGF